MTSVGGTARRLALAITFVSAAAACGDNMPGNDPPGGEDVTLTTAEDTPVTVAISATDPENDTITYMVTTQPAHGALSGTLPGGMYTPDADYHGADRFVVTVSDGEASATIAVDVTITPVNDAPVGTDDALAADEDTTLTVAASTLLANDTDVDDDELTITGVDGATSGTVSLDGTDITFTPTADFLGDATFTYTVSDGELTATATVTIMVGGINDAPVAVDDAVETDEDMPLLIAAATLLANDTDTEGQVLAITAVDGAINGTVALDGTDVTFTPTQDFQGEASFTYTVTDGADSDTATVTVTVVAVNDLPVAVDDTVDIAEDEPLLLTTSTLLDNDDDLDGDVLTVTAVSDPVNGMVELTGTDITFTPDRDFNGVASFVYTMSDGTATDTATVTINIGPGNDAPVAVDDTATTDEDVPLVIEGSVLLANDSDVDVGDELTVFDVREPVHGAVDLEGQTITFVPDANFNGTASFVYTLYDGDQFDTATVTVTVGAQNDAPVAVDDTATTDEDTLLVIATADLLADDTDADLDTLTVAAVASGTGGTAALVGADVTFTPADDFTGEATFTYTVSDGNGGSDQGLVTVTVMPVNDAPVAVDDAATTAEEVALVIPAATLLGNDTDVENHTLTITDVDGAVGGDVSLDGADITFTPDDDFVGAASFTYTVSDGNGGTDTATVAVTVTGVNDAPVAVDDARTTPEDVPLVIAAASLATNDTDIDGDSLTVTAVGGPTNGTVMLTGGNVTFTPAANFNGAASFTYTVSDGNGGTDTGTVTVTVTSVNDAPVAVDDARTTAEDAPLVITAASLAANDTDIDGNTLTVTSVGGSTNGTVLLVGGMVTFTPTANFNGTGSFTYTLSDGNGGTDTGAVSVTVTPVNDAPVAVDDARSTPEDVPLVLTSASLVANDTDIDANTLTVTGVDDASNGTVLLVGTMVTFTPAADFVGAGSFTYTVSDGNGGTDTGLVTVTMTAVNDAPVAQDGAASTTEDTPVAITLVATDLESDALTYAIVTPPASGDLTGTAPNLTYTPDPGFTGTDTFTFTASDADASNVATVTITVAAGPPVCGDGDVEGGEECDDGGTADNDGCNSECETEFCGDGDIQFPLGEQCDDGNGDNGDGCDDACQLEGTFVTTTPVLVSGALACTTQNSNTGRKIAVDGLGNVFVLMVCGGDVQVAVSSDRGLTFGAPEPVGISGATEVAIAAGPAGIAYVAATTGSDVVFTRTTDFGATWEPTQSLGPTFDFEVSIEAFNDDVFVGLGGGSGVQVLRNGARGVGSFEQTDVAISQAYFDVLLDRATGDVLVAADDPSLHVRRSTDGGVTFGPQADPAGTAYFSDWAVGNGLIFAMGVTLISGEGQTLSRILASDLTQSQQVSGFTDTAQSNQRSLAADPTGNAYVVSTLDSSEIQLARLLASSNAPDGVRTLLATGGSFPGVVALPTSTGAAIVYTTATQVYVTIQVY